MERPLKLSSRVSGPIKRVVWLACFMLVLAVGVLWGVPQARSLWYGHLHQFATQYYQNQLIHFSTLQQQTLPPGYLLVYGDSLAQGLGGQALGVPVVNHGIGHARLSTVNRQLAANPGLAQAGAILLSVGINDVLYGRPSAVAEGYQQLAGQLPGGVPVWVQLLLPVDEQALERSGVNAAIASVNAELRALCAWADNWQCLAPSPALITAQGQLAARYHSGDGLHLNALGNAVWLDALADAVSQHSTLRRWRLADS